MLQRKYFQLLFAIAVLACLGPGSLSPLGAQGYSFGEPLGLRGRYRTIDQEWQVCPMEIDAVIRAGTPDAVAPLDGITLKHSAARIEYQVLVAGAWQAWTGEDQPAGTVKKPIEGIKIRADNGSIRYRAASLSAGFSAWVTDGEPSVAADHAPVNALDVRWLPLSKKGASLEFRALFAGHSFTPWLNGGTEAGLGKEPAEKSADLIAIEIRNGQGIRYEVALDGRWQPTVIDGELAGDTTGKHRITSLRVFGGSSPVRYRMKTERGANWTPWFADGTQCPESGPILSIHAIQIEPDRGGP